MDDRIKPTTQIIGIKANQLLTELANENGVAKKYFLSHMLVREARAEATALDGERLKKRLALINEVQDELVDLINNPPQGDVFDWEYSQNPRSIYMKVWQAHKRMASRGVSEEQIHDYCIKRYGLDFPVKETPQKSPKSNPDWVGGGKNARKIEVQ